jgi:hypothetical protein
MHDVEAWKITKTNVWSTVPFDAPHTWLVPVNLFNHVWYFLNEHTSLALIPKNAKHKNKTRDFPLSVDPMRTNAGILFRTAMSCSYSILIQVWPFKDSILGRQKLQKNNTKDASFHLMSLICICPWSVIVVPYLLHRESSSITPSACCPAEVGAESFRLLAQIPRGTEGSGQQIRLSRSTLHASAPWNELCQQACRPQRRRLVLGRWWCRLSGNRFSKRSTSHLDAHPACTACDYKFSNVSGIIPAFEIFQMVGKVDEQLLTSWSGQVYGSHMLTALYRWDPWRESRALLEFHSARVQTSSYFATRH